MNKDLYKIMRLEQIQEQEGGLFCEAEADLIIENEIKEFEEWINMKANYKDFLLHMHLDCGMPLTEDGAVHCCECDEPIYKSDYPNHNWEECPVCGYLILEEE